METKGTKFKVKCQYLNSIATEYEKAKIAVERKELITHASLLKEEGGYYNINDTKLQSYQNFKEYVDIVLSKMPAVDREFIINDFFSNDSLWWVNCYSKSSYYRNKRKALDIFINLYKL